MKRKAVDGCICIANAFENVGFAFKVTFASERAKRGMHLILSGLELARLKTASGHISLESCPQSHDYL